MSQQQTFERFTDEARRSFAKANQAAMRLSCSFIRSEHVLLGIVENDVAVANIVLKKLGLDSIAIGVEIENRVKLEAETNAGEPQAAHRAKMILEHAIYAARGLKRSYVGTEHLLLGILRIPDCTAAHVLISMGINPADVEKEVANLDRPV